METLRDSETTPQRMVALDPRHTGDSDPDDHHMHSTGDKPMLRRPLTGMKDRVPALLSWLMGVPPRLLLHNPWIVPAIPFLLVSIPILLPVASSIPASDSPVGSFLVGRVGSSWRPKGQTKNKDTR